MIRTKAQSTLKTVAHSPIQQSNRQETSLSQASPRGRIYLPLFSLVLLLTLTVLFLAGCSNFQSLAAESATQESTSVVETTIAATPTPTLTPTATPTPTPSPTPTPEVLNDKELSNKTIDIENLTKTVEDGIVVYKNEKGEIQASFNPNIKIGEENIGGYALPVDMVDNLLVESLDKDGSDFKIIIPLDITKGSFELHNSVMTSDGWNLKTLIIKTNQETPIICANNSEGTFAAGDASLPTSFTLDDGTILDYDQNQMGSFLPNLIFEDDSSIVINNDDLYITFQLDDLKNKEQYSSFDETKIFSKREKVGMEINGYLEIWCGSNIIDTSTNDLLLLNGSIVSYYPQEKTVVETGN